MVVARWDVLDGFLVAAAAGREGAVPVPVEEEQEEEVVEEEEVEEVVEE